MKKVFYFYCKNYLYRKFVIFLNVSLHPHKIKMLFVHSHFVLLLVFNKNITCGGDNKH